MHNTEYPDISDLKFTLQQPDSSERSDVQQERLSLRRTMIFCQATEENDAPRITSMIEFSVRSFKE